MQTVILIGAEDVSRAGYVIRDAAQTMSGAASTMSESLERHQRFMEDWLDRYIKLIEAEQTPQPTIYSQHPAFKD